MVLWTLPIDPLIRFHFSLNIYKRIQDNIILLTINTQIHRVHGVKNKQRTTPQWSETGSFVFTPQATTWLHTSSHFMQDIFHFDIFCDML